MKKLLNIILIAITFIVLTGNTDIKRNYSHYSSREVSSYLFLRYDEKETLDSTYLTNQNFKHLNKIERGKSFFIVYAFTSNISYAEGFPNILYDVTILNPNGKIFYTYSNFYDWQENRYLTEHSQTNTHDVTTKPADLIGSYKIVVNFREIVSGHYGSMNLFFELIE